MDEMVNERKNEGINEGIAQTDKWMKEWIWDWIIEENNTYMYMSNVVIIWIDLFISSQHCIGVFNRS